MTSRNRAPRTIDDPVATIRATRQRVFTLRGQLRSGSAASPIDELGREVRQLAELLPALLDTAGTGEAVAKANPCVWPHDLNVERDAEVSRG